MEFVSYFQEDMSHVVAEENGSPLSPATIVEEMPAKFSAYFFEQDDAGETWLCLEVASLSDAPMLTLERGDGSTYMLQPNSFLGGRPIKKPGINE